MSSPNTSLEHTATPAAISRFFYNSESDAGLQISEAFAFSRHVHDRYRDYLCHPISLLATIAIGKDGELSDFDAAKFKPVGALMLAFDTSESDAGMYSWQLNLTNFAANLTSSTHGRTIAAQYVTRDYGGTIFRRLDGQGRAYADMGIRSGDARTPTTALQATIARIINFDALDGKAAKFEADRGRLAQQIIQFDIDHRDSEPNRKKRKTMLKQLHGIAFSSTHAWLKLDDFVLSNGTNIETAASQLLQ